jgi:hypothetical protein
MGVRMRHPDLEQEIEVASSAVPIHEQSGWQPVEGQEVTWSPLPPESLPFGGQAIIRMRHPTLPGQEIRVAESAVPHHRSKGWYVLPEEPEAEEGDGLDGLTVAQLQERAREAGVPVSGTKAELQERLRSPSTTEAAGAEPAQTSKEGEQ